MVGKFLTEKTIKLEFMRTVLAKVWKPGKGVHIMELGDHEGRFLFQFGHEADIKRVMDGGPWSFDNNVLLWSRVKPREEPLTITLHRLPLWVQVHGIPIGLRSESIVKGIGNRLGEFMESNNTNFMGSCRSYVCLRVYIDVHKAMKPDIRVGLKGGPMALVTFFYKRLPTFCFVYGLIGHGEKFRKQNHECESGVTARRLGPELRAVPKRLHWNVAREKWLHSTPFLVGNKSKDVNMDKETMPQKMGENIGTSSGGNLGSDKEVVQL